MNDINSAYSRADFYNHLEKLHIGVRWEWRALAMTQIANIESEANLFDIDPAAIWKEIVKKPEELFKRLGEIILSQE
jgi:hypothetical protein